MIDPLQAAVGIIAMLVVVGGLLYLIYSRTNGVEKTGYGALIMLSLISLMIPIFWIMDANTQTAYKIEQFSANVTRGANLYAQYCYQCHGTQGQGRSGPQLNGNSTVNALSDNDVIRIISGGIYDPSNPGNSSTALMPAWSDRYGGPLTDTDIQNLFLLIRSSDPAYLSKNGYPTTNANGFSQVKTILQTNNPTAYETAVAQEGAGQFGKPVDMTSKKAITINIVNSPSGASCTPACFDPINVKVKVGTTITWVNKSSTPHTVTAITDPTSKKIASQIFDSGLSHLLNPGSTFTYTVTMAAYNFNSSHTVPYYCQIHPVMLGELTVVT
jgi:plastocyanin/mono/diheme cytochrome c family protein